MFALTEEDALEVGKIKNIRMFRHVQQIFKFLKIMSFLPKALVAEEICCCK